ncbi:MAG: PKD domain-containing protein, partial [Bacteroidota bacterium]
MLFDREYDPEQTAAMQLPFNIDGGAFLGEDNTYMYILWAKTQTDQTEEASALYTFPSNFNIETMAMRRWDFSQTEVSIPVGTVNIELDAAPVFLLERTFDYKQPSCTPATVNFEPNNINGAAVWEWEFENGEPATFSGEFPVVFYQSGGNHSVRLTVRDADGNILDEQKDFIFIEGEPEADFEVEVFGPLVTVTNLSSANSDGFSWDFGDGSNNFEEREPTYAYFEEGSYVIELVAYNDCGASTKEITVTINLPDISPVTETANENVTPYEGDFRPGTNLGYFPPWTDMELSSIAAGDRTNSVSGAGVKAIRPAMYGSFVDEWGYDFRVPTFEHYRNLGLNDNTMIVGFPSDSLRDKSRYCETAQSEMFANMYTDIWDNGENGTPINDENYYAAYIYQLLQTYGDYVRFWEIWNEPGFDFTGQRGWRQPGDPEGNWWDRDPDPCEYKLRAPIQHYVRLLRISWEVIKTVAPEDYVVVSGTGYLSFLDAVLRNTDNPVDGSSTASYPLKGGAYFDVMGFHSYPHFDGTTKYYSVEQNGFVYERHSDAAADGLMRVRNNMQEILSRYGYDGNQYPEKLWTITECNIPRRNFNDFIGGDEAQRNFTTKAYINAAINDFVQLHIFSLAEQKYLSDASFEFDLMGLYERIYEKSLGSETKTQAGIAYKTTSDILFGTTYDATQTAALNLPDEVRGAAFRDAMGNYVYALWAATQTDQSEDVTYTYSFPTNIASNSMYAKAWNWSENKEGYSVAAQEVALTASPLFLSEQQSVLNFPVAAFQVEDRIGCPPYTLTFNDVSIDASAWQWSFPGGEPSTSTEQNPVVTYSNAGLYDVSLTVRNELGEHTYNFAEYIDVKTTQSIDFEIDIDGFTLNTTLDSEPIEFTNFLWDFGNGVMFPSYNPSHTYQTNGTYEVKMVPLSYGCPGDTIVKTITIGERPDADFAIMEDANCM